MMIKPMMTYGEIDLVKKYLNKDKTMLEWGSGTSTIYFSKFVKELISIEHDYIWYNHILNAIKWYKIDNIKIFNIKPNKRVITIPSTKRQLMDYINFPKKLNKKFDIIYIDGRARQYCGKISLELLNKDGIVFIHDFFTRKRYHILLEYYDEIDRIDDLIILRKK